MLLPVRRETIEKVQEIAKLLRALKSIREFDEGLFGRLGERVRVLNNMVQVEFMLRGEVAVVEII